MTRSRFFLSIYFLFVFGLLIARAFPGSSLVNDPLFVCDFGYSISSRNRCRFGRFFLAWTIFSQHLVYDENIFLRHVRMYSSLMFVRAKFSSVDACSTRFWAYLITQTWSARALSLGRTATKAPPPVGEVSIIVWELFTVAFLSLS